MNRRRFLSAAGAAWVTACADPKASRDTGSSRDTATGPTSGTGSGGTRPTGTTPPTESTLPIPPELTGVEVDGRWVYELTARPGTHHFGLGLSAATLGYNGDILGPTLRLRRGRPVTIHVTNGLDEVTTAHWHGAHVPAQMDGGPHQPIAPGARWSAEFTVNQPAATLFYHPHAMGSTGRQVYTGLAGLLVIDDDDTDALGLPQTYGVDDIPLILQDRRFTGDGELDYRLSMHDEMVGMQGDVFLTNGVVQPMLSVGSTRVRFRILNGCNARLLRLGFEDRSPMAIIAGDASLIEAPIWVDEIVLSPAERVEVVVDLTGRAGETLVLADHETGGRFLTVEVVGADDPGTVLPDRLITLPRLDPSLVAHERTFELTRTMGPTGQPRINGVSMDLAVINEVVPLDRVEIWEVSNPAMGMMEMHHNFHMHATHFEVLERNGLPPEPWETGFKDTVLLLPGDRVRLLVKHVDYADADHPYMYHCHVLEHEDAGMMGQFVVVS
ncbi:MAG: FtsP/CotA-like multicopper oxidase with cupredoxin domain [Myxococcota bacterium]|jgi:FtsP/CotA-like multicopper oxidase with cupredoxin domain